ncbi:nicotinate-nucleotide adenylyltransferase [Aerophototrophica crusticola]|uniref:Probable nicotinate-nucleotide adenylyltransferase n=1 Tax=Aerophototrophica crusticola TaxID=1709002 RepID=A0A858R8D5_9PROT|nr:nicotinate-nucleotide adenylyltransferase [Rhodospirillaceae bacterium B3]
MTRSLPRPLAGKLWDGMVVGLLGGSFNPAHGGHRFMSLQALRHLGLDQVWWLVSPQNPLKAATGMADLSTRLRTARARASHPRIVVTDIERELGTRFTAETLGELTRRFPRTRFVWLMGADNLSQIPRWKDWTGIFGMVPVAVFPRRPYSIGALGGKAARRFARARVGAAKAQALPTMEPPAWTFIGGPLHPASATDIRARGDSLAWVAGDRDAADRV